MLKSVYGNNMLTVRTVYKKFKSGNELVEDQQQLRYPLPSKTDKNVRKLAKMFFFQTGL